jgi:hypothetical protein
VERKPELLSWKIEEGLPLASEALKKIKDAKVAAAVESLDAFANNAMTQLFNL